MPQNLTSLLAALGLTLTVFTEAAAVPVVGNECGAGGFDNCTFMGSPSIAKFDVTLIASTFNGWTSEGNQSKWPSLDVEDGFFPGSAGTTFHIGEFTLNISGDLKTITWSYVKNQVADPDLVWVILKAGNAFDAFPVTDTSDVTMTTETLDNKALSHITFFDTTNGNGTVPEPGTLLLAGAALATVALMRRRRP